MVFFSKNSSRVLVDKLFQLNVKKGVRENLEKVFLRISYQVWRRKRNSLLFCLSNTVKDTKPYINLKSVISRGTSLKIPFFILEKKRISLVLGWIQANSEKGRLFSELETFFLENSKKKEEFKERKKNFHEVANQHKVFAHKRWF